MKMGIEMYTEDQQRLLKMFDELAAELGSQSKACERIAIGKGVISSIKNNKYTGNVEKQFKILESYFEVKHEAKYTYSSSEYVDTSISHQVCGILRNCQINGGLAMICGGAGIGKTMAIQEFHREHSIDSFRLTCNPCYRGLKGLLKMLAREVGATVYNRMDELWESIRKELSDGQIIIIDEAQELSLRIIDALRSFCDYFAERGQTLGIALVGNPQLIHRIEKCATGEYDQVKNRTKKKAVLTVSAITKEDIRKLFPLLDREDAGAEIEFLWRLSREPMTSIRGITNLFANAYDNEDYTLNGLRTAAKDMRIFD